MLTVSSSSVLAVSRHSAHAARYHGRGHRRHIVWNPLIRGSHESLLRQNEEIDRLQLPRIEDEAQLEDLKSRQELVSIKESKALRVDPRLDPERRYCRPWTLEFLQDMSLSYYKEFHSFIQVNSAVRTVEQQRRLRRVNRNAAPDTGETASSHLAGLTVDISKRGLSRKQHKWIENYLSDLREQGLIEAAEERHQACFHVMVSERYVNWREERISASAGE